jgi:hypothetical protein
MDKIKNNKKQIEKDKKEYAMNKEFQELKVQSEFNKKTEEIDFYIEELKLGIVYQGFMSYLFDEGNIHTGDLKTPLEYGISIYLFDRITTGKAFEVFVENMGDFI